MMQDSICTKIDLWAIRIINDTTSIPVIDRGVDVAHLFGPNSQLVAEQLNVPGGTVRELLGSSVTSWQYDLMSLILILMLGYTLFRYINIIPQLLKLVFSVRPIVESFNNLPTQFLSFFRYFRFAQLIPLSIVMTLLLEDLAPQVNQFSILTLFGSIVAMLLFVQYFKLMMLMLISRFDFDKQRWRDWLLLRGDIISTLTLIFSTILAVIMLFEAGSVLLIVIISLLAGYYIFQNILIFLTLGFSFLQAILYLCAFEIAPFLVIYGAVRSLSIL